MKRTSMRTFCRQSGNWIAAGILLLIGAGFFNGIHGVGNTGGESDSDPLLTYKVGMGQILVEGGAVEANLNRAVSMIEQAAKSGCRIVVLPECLDCGWTYPESAILAQPVPGESSDVLAKAALKNNIYVVAGLTEKAGERIYNTAVLIADTGDILLKHRKINVLTIAQDIYAIGDRLGVAHTPLGTIGIDICADNFPDTLVLGHSLARMGAQLILAPSAWAVDADHDNNKNPYGGSWMRSHSELARLYDLTVMSVSNVGWINAGVWKGRKCIGCSLAVGPGGNKLAESPYGETAEHLTVVEVTILPRVVTGTAITEMLRKKGN